MRRRRNSFSLQNASRRRAGHAEEGLRDSGRQGRRESEIGELHLAVRTALRVVHWACAVRHLALHSGAYRTHRLATAACASEKSQRSCQQGENDENRLEAAHEAP